MKKMAKFFAILCMFTILIASFTACQQTQAVDGPQNPIDIPPDEDEKAIEQSYTLDSFFGKTDEELVEAKGSEGQKGTVTIDKNEFLLCRIYRELFFGIDSEVTYMYENDTINKLSVGMRDTEPQAAIDALVEKLGDTEDVSQNGDNYVLKAVWETENITYQMIYDGLVVTVIVEPAV